MIDVDWIQLVLGKFQGRVRMRGITPAPAQELAVQDGKKPLLALCRIAQLIALRVRQIEGQLRDIARVAVISAETEGKA